MAFIIPNEDDAGFLDQSAPDSRDFRDILAPGFNLTGVVSGCAVTAQGSPDMTVAVASGEVVVGGTTATVSGGNVTVGAADATDPRFDLICVDSSGTKSCVAGTAAPIPAYPDPGGDVVLATVYVPATDTDIDANQINDKRIIIKPWAQLAGDTMTGPLYLAGGPLFDVRAFGAVADGTTDDFDAIDAAIDAAITAGGGAVMLAPGVSSIESPIVINDDQVMIVGHGWNGYHYTSSYALGSKLEYNGSPTAAMVTFATLPAATAPLRGGGIVGVSLDGNDLCDIGLLVLSTYGQLFERVRVDACVDACIKLDVTTPMDVGGAFACQSSRFQQIATRFGSSSEDGIGIMLSGPSTADTGNPSFLTFQNIEIVHKNGVGMQFGDSDSNVLSNVRITRASGGTAIGVELLGSTDAVEGHARGNVFFALDAGAGGLTSRANTGSARNNSVYNYWKENSAPDPTIEYGSTLNWTTEVGVNNFIGSSTYTKASAQLTFALQGDGQNSQYRTSVWATAPSTGPAFMGRRFRGTINAPRRTNSGDDLAVFGGVGGYAADDSTDATLDSAPSTRMFIEATENWTASAKGASVNFYTTPNTSTTAVSRLTIGPGNGISTGDASVFTWATGTSNGVQIGTTSSNKLGFFGATPVIQPTSTTDLRSALINLGLYATGGASPLNLNGGALTAGASSVGTLAVTDTLTMTDAKNIVLGSSTGNKIGTATSQKLAFFNATPVDQPSNTAKAREALEELGLLATGGAEPREFQIKVFDDTTALSTGDGKAIFVIPASLNGLNLILAHAYVTTVSSSGLPTVQIRNITQAADMLSTRITIDVSEFRSFSPDSPATAPVIDTANDDVATGDLIAIDVDVAGTGAKGLGVILTFGL